MTCPKGKEYQLFNDKINESLPKWYCPLLKFCCCDENVKKNIHKLKELIDFNTLNDLQLKIMQEQASQIRAYKLQTLSIGILFAGGITLSFFLTGITANDSKLSIIMFIFAAISFFIGFNTFRRAKEMFQTCNIIISECMECKKNSWIIY